MNLNQPVAGIMTTGLVTVSPQQELVDVKHIFEKKEFHHHIPVTENGRLVGMISLVDYMRYMNGVSLNDEDIAYHHLKVSDIMSPHPFEMSPGASIREVAEEFAKGEFHAVALTAKGKLEGIVTTTDLIRFFLAS